MPLRSVFLWTMIVSLSLAAAMGIIAILAPGFGTTQERVLLTALIVGAFSLPALACSIVMGRKRFVGLMWVGIAATMLALTLWLALIWIDFWQWQGGRLWNDMVARFATAFTVMSITSAHAGLLSLLRLERAVHRFVRRATIIVAVALGVVVVICVWGEIFDDWMGRLLGILSILAACGTIVTPVLALIELLQRRSGRETIPSRLMIDLTCPRCMLRQPLPAGTARCAQCALRIDIDVEEPRCQCGYLLYQLQSDACPECGRTIGVDQRTSSDQRPRALGS